MARPDASTLGGGLRPPSVTSPQESVAPAKPALEPSMTSREPSVDARVNAGLRQGAGQVSEDSHFEVTKVRKLTRRAHRAQAHRIGAYLIMCNAHDFRLIREVLAFAARIGS